MAISAFHRYSQDSRVIGPASPKERIVAQLIDGIFLGVICGLWLAVYSDGLLYSVWVSPMIPVYLLQVTPEFVPQVTDWWWGGCFKTLSLPVISDLHIACPSPVLWAIYAGYYTFFHTFWGNTPGKMLKSLVVLNDRNRIPTLAESFWRWLGYLISILPLGLGFLTAVKQENCLTWHDKLAGTRVLCFEND